MIPVPPLEGAAAGAGAAAAGAAFCCVAGAEREEVAAGVLFCVGRDAVVVGRAAGLGEARAAGRGDDPPRLPI